MASTIWSPSEISQYLQEGYDQLVMDTGSLFGVGFLPDYAFAFNYTQDFEQQYITPGWYADGPAQYTTFDERDFINNAKGPANHTEHWEFNLGYQTLTSTNATPTLPEDLNEIDRATWNSWRLQTWRTRDLAFDSRYEINTGLVEGYIQDKDGLRVLRKWRVPAQGYVVYTFITDVDLAAFTYTQTWESTYLPKGAEANGPLEFTSGGDARFMVAGDSGPGTHSYSWEVQYGYARKRAVGDGHGILCGSLSDFSPAVYLPDGDFGDVCGVDNVECFNDFGIIGPIYKAQNNVTLEYRRRGLPLSTDQDFEIPTRYQTYVRHYAEARALEREGTGQDLELAAHYQGRYEAGVARMNRRRQAMRYQQTLIMGGMPQTRGNKPPHPRLPWPYGTVVR